MKKICIRCGINDGRMLYRISPKGEMFEGACHNCLTPTERLHFQPERDFEKMIRPKPPLQINNKDTYDNP